LHNKNVRPKRELFGDSGNKLQKASFYTCFFGCIFYEAAQTLKFKLTGSGENATAAAVAALIVVVINKDDGVHAVGHAPTLAKRTTQAVSHFSF